MFLEKKYKEVNRILVLLILDVLVIQLSAFFALFIRFDFKFSEIPVSYLEDIIKYALPNTLFTILIFGAMKLYRSIWRYASASEMLKIIGACTLSFLIQPVLGIILHIDLPRSFYFIYFISLLICISCIRFGYRILSIFAEKRKNLNLNKTTKKIMIVGAGAAGNAIIKEIQGSDYLNIKVECIIDDNDAKQGKYLRGIPIVGKRSDIQSNVNKYGIDEIMVTIPSSDSKNLKDILEICQETGCKTKILPGMYQIITGEVNVSKLRDVQIEDLLGREPITVDMGRIMDYVQDKIVLITGGGGSIGSELCRQIARHKPRRMIIIDIYENNVYDIQQELVKNYPDLDLVVLIASVRNEHRINMIFEKYHPDIVYHAAAHKHVPLMEDSPNEAIKNNVMGTYKVAEAADKYNTERFVLISTDKAVNPTSLMGASKRLCEMIIQMFARNSKTNFVAVRFGNVLGSNGSVIPLFKKQILEGGPVTVTHPDIIRYFMTIPEAVSLVLQAGAYANGGEIFVLDMGEPVKILELAKNLIKLSGYRINEDIQIVYTGLRPGEKLYEELLMDEEGLKNTENKRIFIGHPIKFDENLFKEQLKQLDILSKEDCSNIKEVVRDIIPTYVITNNE